MLPLRSRVLEPRNTLTAYDAMYVALVELPGVPLLTGDATFAGSTGHRAEIHRYPPPPVQTPRRVGPRTAPGRPPDGPWWDSTGFSMISIITARPGLMRPVVSASATR